MLAGKLEVESILDDRRPMETRTWRSGRKFLLKWAGYDEPMWEPMTYLSCGGLLYDYLRKKLSSQIVQMVQVADKDLEPTQKWTAGGGVQPALPKSYCTMIVCIYGVNELSNADLTKWDECGE
ncbi:unnamed protein product [Phytophthora fragariaefolia]|uniref:Unnamed protein product n=1 Tax=Phytophthora fragariaefolia TaxID=1490495 RepID=A0A9W6XC68_9STRA|nr:unnamed protein product [Phytophthora fragariaefolia]